MADDDLVRAYRSNIDDRRRALPASYVDSPYARNVLRDRASRATGSDWKDRAITRAEAIGHMQDAIAGQGQQQLLMSAPDPYLQYAFEQAITPQNPELHSLLFNPNSIDGSGGDLPRRR